MFQQLVETHDTVIELNGIMTSPLSQKN